MLTHSAGRFKIKRMKPVKFEIGNSVKVGAVEGEFPSLDHHRKGQIGSISAIARSGLIQVTFDDEQFDYFWPFEIKKVRFEKIKKKIRKILNHIRK